MKTYNVQFRQSFDMVFNVQVEASSEQDAEKKVMKMAAEGEIDINDFDTCSPQDDGDDFCVTEADE
jgi:hypothetical protein